ncbi:hypothetical protein BJF78_28700 [Pseudonocardia sp. CNS-139]|nr:hypothetical protein BJF78_28700 [Pseudonocardia sp. CNS-139]
MTALPHTDPFSTDALRAEIAALLDEDVAAIDPDEELPDLGLDSVRVMTLLERWRAAGADVSLDDLAAEPTIAAWHRLLTSARG